jgi:glutathione S-transferase
MGNETDYVLYWGSGSPFASRVMIYLYEKDIAFESCLIQFYKKEYKTEEFLKMNPRGQIPLLIDRSMTPNVYIYEGLTIL